MFPTHKLELSLNVKTFKLGHNRGILSSKYCEAQVFFYP